MHKLNASKIVKTIKIGASKHSPEILTGIGIAGMITTTVLAVKATPRALDIMHDAEFEMGVDKLRPIDTVKLAWKPYVPAAITGVLSITCLIGASSVNAKRNAALATAYQLSETALTKYREKVVETIGEKKEQVVRDKIAEDRVKENPASKNEIFITDKGNTLCLDYASGRYFKSDIDIIRKAENRLNKQMLSEDYVSLNDLYDELGLSHTELGDDLGWSIDGGLIELQFSSQIADDGKTPCIVIDYNIAPKYGYSKFA